MVCFVRKLVVDWVPATHLLPIGGRSLIFAVRCPTSLAVHSHSRAVYLTKYKYTLLLLLLLLNALPRSKEEICFCAYPYGCASDIHLHSSDFTFGIPHIERNSRNPHLYTDPKKCKHAILQTLSSAHSQLCI